MRTLVIVPCGSKKVWTKSPALGAVPARDAYTGTPFVVNREYAETVGDAWVILSAKYGYLWPDELIPGPYEVTFKKRQTQPVTSAVLGEQVRDKGLLEFEQVLGLGGIEYRAAIAGSFPAGGRIEFPFAGLQLGYALQATKRAIQGRQRVELQPPSR